MKLKENVLWHPGRLYKGLILIGGALLVTAIGYVHKITGLSYEFHPFFIFPVLAVSWFLGRRFGYVLGLLADIEWFMADRMLSGDQSSLEPLLFNTVVRLTIFAGGAWLVDMIRNILLNEARLASEDTLTQPFQRRRGLYSLHLRKAH